MTQHTRPPAHQPREDSFEPHTTYVMGGTEAAGDWFAIGDLGTYCTHRTVALVRPFFGPLPLAPLSLCLLACLPPMRPPDRPGQFIHSFTFIYPFTNERRDSFGDVLESVVVRIGPSLLD